LGSVELRSRLDHGKDVGGIRKSAIFWYAIILMEETRLGKMLSIQKADDRVIFTVNAQPGVAKNEIVGVQGDALKTKINAPAVKGKANKALVHFLARKLGVRNSQVEVISGHTSRLKRIKVIGEGTKTKEKISRLTTLQS